MNRIATNHTKYQTYANQPYKMKPKNTYLMTDAWELKLYIAGKTIKSQTALTNLKKYCEVHLKGNYKLEIIDLLKKPQLAEGDQIFAIPTLVKKVPEPIRKIIGDLSDEEKVLVGLNIVPVKKMA